MSALILDWQAAAQAGAAVAGGKGWQLGRMAMLGVAVPDGFVIAAEASVGREQGQAVPHELAAALEQEIDRRGWRNRPLAVRSSAPQEDSARASFAGMHRSELNVTGIDALLDAVRSVWDSVWEAPAVAYRQKLGLDDGALSMAVVVMPLLPAVSAGVVFTCDPVSGRDDQALINAHWGLGEALVGGHADVDEYRLQQNDFGDGLYLLEQRIGAKRKQSVASAEGGTLLVETPADVATRAVLTAEQAVEIGLLARDAAFALDYAHAGYDVEWVWDGERFWIVQARPVTARGRHTYPALMGQPALWSRGNTREVLPEPLSPLDWAQCRVFVNQMLTRSYELAGYSLLPGVERAGLFHGRLYLEASLLQWEGYDALGVAPKAINHLMGGYQPEITIPPANWRDKLGRGIRLLHCMRRSVGRRRRALEGLARAREQARGWRLEPLPDDNAALAAKLYAQFRTVHAADDLFFLQGAAGGSLWVLVEQIEKHCPGQGHALAAALMAGGEPSVTARQAYELADLAKVAEADATALAWLRDGHRDSTQWAAVLPADSPFRQAFADFLERYGHRAVMESYFRSPRWREQPGYLFDSILGLVGSDMASVRQRQREATDAAWQRIRRDVPFMARGMIKRLVRNATMECNHREAARSAFTAYVDVARRCVLALGRRLTGPGGLAQPDDLFNLSLAEICATAEGRLPVACAARRAAERQQQLQAWAAEPEPDVIQLHADATAPAIHQPRADVHDGQWAGMPVGTGVAQGTAFVAYAPGEGTAMQAGEVLVAPSTDPAWTPLFLKAGALVMETGGFLSHGAIVAREFGIPAVVNLPGILSRFETGEPVEVDGNRGVVRRLAG